MGDLTSRKPTFSISMPSYNHARYIREAISSVLEQENCGELELIIVDDFSTDGSRDIIREEAARDSRIKVVLHDANMGISRTVNEAKGLSTGEYMLTLASDDKLVPGALAKMLEAFQAPSPVDVVIFEGKCVDRNGNPLGYNYSEIHLKPPSDMANVFSHLLKGNFIMAGATRASSVWERGIRLNEQLRFLSDWIYWIDVAAESTFRYLPDPLYIYRIHGKNASFMDGWISDSARAYSMIEEKHSARLSKAEVAYIRYMEGLSFVKIGRVFEGRRALLSSLSCSPFSNQGAKTAVALISSFLGNLGSSLLGAYGALRFSHDSNISMHRIRKRYRGEETREKGN